MPHPDPLFAPRPWPPRERHPLNGKRVLICDPGSADAQWVSTTLAELGCGTRVIVPEEWQRGFMSAEWDVVLLAHGARKVLADITVRPSLMPALVLVTEADEDVEHESLAADVFAVLEKPLTKELLLVTIGRALEQHGLQLENRSLRQSLSDRFALGSIVTRDKRMRAVLKTVESIAETKANVLLSGESGTGKTMLAHTIHQLSDRAEKPFVVVNCGSLPDSLLESELFGHVRGAFTGAIKDKLGRFEAADGGTLFLDEINSASLDLQVKLLRAIQDRTFERVGDPQTRAADVRIVTASNRDLLQEVAEGRFREDLYYRIHVVSLELPPLRERPGDIALLANHFLQRSKDVYAKSVESIAADCLRALVEFDWPGNIRQLENAIERAVLLSSGAQLKLDDLGEEIRRHAEPLAALHPESLVAGLQHLATLPPLKQALEGPERQIIMRALEIHAGNRNETAEMLQINRTTLFNKMKKYGLMDVTFE